MHQRNSEEREMLARKKKTIVSKRQIYRRVAASNFVVFPCTELSSSRVNPCSNVLLDENSLVCDNNNVYDYANNQFSLRNVSAVDNLNLVEGGGIDIQCLKENSYSPPNVFSNDLLLDNLSSNELTLTPNNLCKELTYWATKSHVRRTVFTHLLHILHPYHNELPLDSRTLLKTPRHTTIKKLQNGKYCHFGLIEGIKLKLMTVSNNILQYDTIQISFNIDGLPIFHKGHKLQLWPILALVKNFKFEPFVVGSFLGEGKPDSLSDYMDDFLKELLELLRGGININKSLIKVQVHSFVCDAPARAYLKSVKQHSGYASCDRCEDYGVYHGRIIFQNFSATRRDDISFRTRRDKHHHHGESPLLVLPIDMVFSFPIDYMHEVCLGVMKKLLKIWTGQPISHVKLHRTALKSISQKIVSLSKFIPVEFNRKGCDLTYLADWKATELRLFLLYTGPIVLYGDVDLAVYEHFMLFSCSIMILLSKRHIKNLGISLARQFLELFVKHSVRIYGIEFLVYNVHLLIHLADDAEMYGPLDNISAFPFENYLGHLKSLVQSPNNPLQQIHRRLKEFEIMQCENCEYISPQDSKEYDLPHFSDKIKFSCKQYKKLRYKDFQFCIFSHSEANCFCLTTKGLVIKIQNIVVDSDDVIYILGNRFQTYNSFFKYPIDSKKLNICRIEDLSQNVELWPRDQIVSKCVVFPLHDRAWVSLPLLHH